MASELGAPDPLIPSTHVLASACLAGGLHRALPPHPASQPPSGELWLHEIKHDGFRVIAREDGTRVELYSRPDNDLTKRFPLIVEALARLRPGSCVNRRRGGGMRRGWHRFDRIRYRRHDAGVFLYAFDLVELDGDDLRRDPLAVRKATLASLLARAASVYSAEVAWAICDRLVEGESLRAICSDAGMPARATVFRWIARHKEFRDRYISARDFQAEGLGEEMLEIVRDTSGDDLARARLRALERQAARMAPRKYGR